MAGCMAKLFSSLSLDPGTVAGGRLPEHGPVENPSVIKWIVLRLRFRRVGLQSFIEDAGRAFCLQRPYGLANG
jgi:hypothetical protein